MRRFVLFAILVATGVAGALAASPLVVLPYQSTLTLPEGKYGVQLCSGACKGLAGRQGKDGKMEAVVVDVDGTSSCPSPNGYGMIKLSSKDSIEQQRKVLIHEVVHIAMACDQRNSTIEERIAEDVSALYDDQFFHAFMTGGK